MHNILFSIIILSLISCSSDKPAGLESKTETGLSDPKGEKIVVSSEAPGAGQFSLNITPSEATRSSSFNLLPTGFNLDDADIVWLVNGKPVPGSSNGQFSATSLKKGDMIQAKATIAGKEILSNIVKVVNAPPEISRIKFMPEVFKPGDILYVDVTGSDADGDEVTILYEWTNNGEPAGNDKKIAAPLKRGDKISIKITPFDGTVQGQTAVLQREIGNMPPHIIDDRKYTFDGRTYKYQIKASDPDNDPLSYSLKTSPAGMTINQSTGLVQWNVPPDFTGKASFTVTVTDGQGGQAVQDLAVNITPEKAK